MDDDVYLLLRVRKSFLVERIVALQVATIIFPTGKRTPIIVLSDKTQLGFCNFLRSPTHLNTGCRLQRLIND